MIRVLIIGKKSFLGSNLKRYLSPKFNTSIISYNDIEKKNKIFFNSFTHIINTSISKKYVNQKYNSKYDLDFNFIKNFKEVKFFYIFLNTRKIYALKEYITERSKIKPIDNYSKNKLITEKYLKKKIKNKLISLRTSNIIGKRIFKKSRNSHRLFFDNFIIYRKKYLNNPKKILIDDDFKDFLSVEQFCKIITKIIKLKIKGIYNVSISEKIYISEIISWIDKNFFKKIIWKNNCKDSFTLSNKKLLNKIKIKITKNELKKFCKKLI